jgi:hypothetical protein
MKQMKKPNSIWLLHLFSNGDCLYATTIARQIKKDYPGSALVWIISLKCAAMLKNNPDIDEIKTVDIIPGKDPIKLYEELVKSAVQKKEQGEILDFFATQIIGDNFAQYDGCVRTSIYRCYPKPISIDQTPILCLEESEKKASSVFFSNHQLDKYKRRILFECAPMSGQALMTEQFIAAVCKQIIDRTDACIILSSYKTIPIDLPGVIDGSTLSIRETVAFSHSCDLLIGCSSGITWACTSTAGKDIPMLQILDKKAYIFNPPSIAIELAGGSNQQIIELFDFEETSISSCVATVFEKGIVAAKTLYNQPTKKQFRLFRGIVHSFLKQAKFKMIFNFIRMNLSVNGLNPSMCYKILQGFLFFPIELINDKIKK